MNEDFIRYVLIELNGIYPNHKSISDIARKYKNRKFDFRELKDIVNDCEYIEKISPSYLVKINPKGIEFIKKNYSSKSGKIQKRKRITPIINAIKILNPVWKSILAIMVLGFGGLLTYILIELYKAYL